MHFIPDFTKLLFTWRQSNTPASLITGEQLTEISKTVISGNIFFSLQAKYEKFRERYDAVVKQDEERRRQEAKNLGLNGLSETIYYYDSLDPFELKEAVNRTYLMSGQYAAQKDYGKNFSPVTFQRDLTDLIESEQFELAGNIHRFFPVLQFLFDIKEPITQSDVGNSLRIFLWRFDESVFKIGFSVGTCAFARHFIETLISGVELEDRLKMVYCARAFPASDFEPHIKRALGNVLKQPRFSTFAAVLKPATLSEADKRKYSLFEHNWELSRNKIRRAFKKTIRLIFQTTAVALETLPESEEKKIFVKNFSNFWGVVGSLEQMRGSDTDSFQLKSGKLEKVQKSLLM